MKRISILGSTGSIGTQALDVIDKNRDRFQVLALSCARSLKLLLEQVEKFQPEVICVENESDAKAISQRPEIKGRCQVCWGKEGLKEIATLDNCDIVINSLMGMRGLEPTLAAIEKGKDIAFANKETLVVGGELVMKAVKRKGVKLLPVDSEHSAIFQALQCAFPIFHVF
ncbi:MAG: hypothetical protein Q4B78_03530 [Bacillota bacterium]|nr:hypothetical protein [Bacillota bacterium]